MQGTVLGVLRTEYVVAQPTLKEVSVEVGDKKHGQIRGCIQS